MDLRHLSPNVQLHRSYTPTTGHHYRPPPGHGTTHSIPLSHLAYASDKSRMPVTVSIIIEGIGVRELFSRFYSTVSVL